MTDRIKPVLTPAEFRNEGMDQPSILGDIRYHDDPQDLAKVIATANHLLPDSDPRKVTRATVTALRQAAEDIENADGMITEVPPAHAPVLRSIADALESYLPPEGA